MSGPLVQVGCEAVERESKDVIVATLPALRVRVRHVSLQAQARVRAGSLLLRPGRHLRPEPLPPLRLHGPPHTGGREIVLVYW